jgi:hypothetical protein
MKLSWQRFSSEAHIWLRTIVLLVSINSLFFLLSFSVNMTPAPVISDRIRRAFERGDLVESDYLPYDVHRGFHQYNDCNILQMITNSDTSLAGRSLGPWLHLADLSAEEACTTLRELVVDGRDPATLISSRYTRYWHGYIPIISVLLTFFEISASRTILRIMVYSGVLLLLLSGAREGRLLLLTVPVAASGLFFWGLPYFGQGMSHTLGDVVVMLGLAGLVFWHYKFINSSVLIPYSATFGAVVVYFEMLTGPLPIAAGLLFPTVYLISRLTNPTTQADHHFRLASQALVAFTLGALLTVGARVLVAVALVQPSGLDTFAGNLELYTQTLDANSFVPGFLRPFGRLLRRGAVLTYGSSWGLIALYVTAGVGWAAGTLLALSSPKRQNLADLLALVIGATAIPAWTILLQTHTFIHADFMARMLIVPVSLGWAALFWQIWLRRA